jgi:CDP-diacylglycerol--glycerol-3-phosphate 3-phosphatidyltransferase
MKKDKILTLSNLLSFLRIFLIIPIYFLISESKNEIAIVVIIIAIITDWLDGYFARKFNQITEIGKILDPLADKVCTTGGFIALTLYQGFPLYLTGLIILRDIIILIGSLFIIKRTNFVAPSNIPGKITVFFITFLGGAYILKWEILYQPLTILVLLMIVLSAINYVIVFLKKVKVKNDT